MIKSLSALLLLGLLAGCGEPVEQNEIALVMNTLGDRGAETVNQFDAELISGARAPWSVTHPTQIVLKFPLGLQAYEFSERAGAESPGGEAFTCGAVGGSINFDVVVHLRIDETMPDIKDRLIKLMQDYQLRRYNGDENVLAELVQKRFKQFLRAPVVDWCAPKQMLSIMRSKAEVNQLLLDHMNAEFNKYGIVFSLAAVSSSMRVPEETQGRMNDAVSRETNTRVLALTNTKLKPLEDETATITENGLTAAAAVVNTAKLEAAETLAEAERYARQALIQLLGTEEYIRYQTEVKALEALRDGGAIVTLVPDDTRIYLGETNSKTGE